MYGEGKIGKKLCIAASLMVAFGIEACDDTSAPGAQATVTNLCEGTGESFRAENARVMGRYARTRTGVIRMVCAVQR